jgi:hypothetical protein
MLNYDNSSIIFNLIIRTFKFCLLLTVLACSEGVVRRNNTGQKMVDPGAAKKFNPVKKKVALLTFFNESPFGGDDLGVVATEEIRMELARTENFLFETQGSKIFGNSKEVYAGGGVKLVQLSRQAKIAGINFVLFGRIIDARIRQKTDEIGFVRQTKSFMECQMEIRIFDVNSNKEIYNEVIKAAGDDQNYKMFSEVREENLTYRRELLRYVVKLAARQAIPKVVETSGRLDWVGRVAKIISTKIYLNAGRASGIQVGDILKVITEGEEIFDPETGALIGVSKGEVKGTIEVIDYFGPDGAVAILHSGGQVHEGDFV